MNSLFHLRSTLNITLPPYQSHHFTLPPYQSHHIILPPYQSHHLTLPLYHSLLLRDATDMRQDVATLLLLVQVEGVNAPDEVMKTLLKAKNVQVNSVR